MTKIKTKDAKKGGYLVGKPHSEGGIKGINVDTGEPIEVEGGEVVITKPAVSSTETYEFEGKEMKPKEILSQINSDHGGVAFAKGGEIDDGSYAEGGKTKEDRSGNPIGDGSWHTNYDVYEFAEYPQIRTIVDKSKTSESVYVYYINDENNQRATVRFSNHENNAVKLGDQLNGRTASKLEVLYHLGLAERTFIPDTYLFIHIEQRSPKKLHEYQFADKTIQELYAMGEGADISKYKGKIAKDSNYEILSDTVTRETKRGRNKFGQDITYGSYKYIPLADTKDSYAKGGKTKEDNPISPTTQVGFDRKREKAVFEKKDTSNSRKYELLHELAEEEISKWSILRGLVDKSDTFRGNEIDRKIAKLREQRDGYALKKHNSFDLLKELAKTFSKQKIRGGSVNNELLAPNGQPTELTEEQYYAVRSEGFLAWFGDWMLANDLDNHGGVSKILNERTGEPLLLYNGSRADKVRWRFDKFPAAYFADNRSYSQWFADQYGGQDGLFEVFLDMKNPIEMRQFGVDKHPIRTYLKYFEDNYLILPEQADQRIAKFAKSNPENTEEYLNFECRVWEYIRHHNKDFLIFLRDQTFFDGIIMYENNPQDIVDGQENVTGSFVVFRAGQIKWADALHFNSIVKDARFERGGKIENSTSDMDVLNGLDFVL